jgi:hypothetical protein
LPASPDFQTHLTEALGVHPFSWVKGFCLIFLKKYNYIIKKGRLCSKCYLIRTIDYCVQLLDKGYVHEINVDLR